MKPLVSNKLLADYLLIIEPRKDLSDRIMEIKSGFAKTYQANECTKSLPHLTLVRFKQSLYMEEKIRGKLRNICNHKSTLCIALSGYGSFPAHTIYINVNSRIAVQDIVRTIRTETQTMLKPNNDNKPHFILEPHITIARQLKSWQYEKGWRAFQHKNFSSSFIATNLLMLRKQDDENHYSPIERFEFQNIPIPGKQTSLF
ncbi:MAG: 2'-5' RNA ligase family protein [Niabella sp.]